MELMCKECTRANNSLIGSLRFFYRENRKTKDIVSGWVGPAYVFGCQGKPSVKKSFFGRPAVQQAVAVFKSHRKGVTYQGLREQGHPTDKTLDGQILRNDVDDSETEEPKDVDMFEETWHADKKVTPPK